MGNAAASHGAHQHDEGRLRSPTAHNDMEAAGAILDALETSRSTTKSHSTADLALRALIWHDVLLGVSASLWGDEKCYDVLANAVYGGGLPWPLKRWLPRSVQRRVMKSGETSGVTQDAAKTADAHRGVLVRRAVDALEALCRSIDEDDEKMSLGTRSVLAATCLTIRCMPVSEALRSAARGLDAWLDGVVREVVVGGKVGRAVPAALADARWAGVRVMDEKGVREGGEGADGTEGTEGRLDRTSTYWLVGIGALAVLYAAMLLRESVEIEVLEDDDGQGRRGL